VHRPTLTSYFTDADGEGLADRTQRRFFSEGSLPEDGVIDRGTTGKEVAEEAQASLTFPMPAVAHLDLRQMGKKRYLVVDGRRTLAYELVPGRVRFSLDRAVYADAARALLPEVEGYVAGLVDHLLRGGLGLAASGRQVTIKLEGTSGTPKAGVLRLFAEDDHGMRRELPRPDSAAIMSGATVSVEAPAGAKRLAALFSGDDAAGPFVASGEVTLN
jgi:hypothetical protein